MQKSMKTMLATTAGLVAMTIGIAPNAVAQAFPPAPCAACSNWVISPDDNTFASGQTVNITNGTLAIDYTASGHQQGPANGGIFGAGFTLLGGGTVKFDSDLHTWDANPFDSFIVTMSTAGYLWNTGVGASSWSWGGTNYTDGVLENYTTGPGGSDSISLIHGGPVYVSLALKTTNDNLYPSWGSFHVNVSAIPEPETYAMLLAGLGLMGFVARRRQRTAA